MTTIRAEIGTSGNVATVEVTGDARTDIATAVELEHGCSDDSCDIARALEDGYALWAANLLIGATECPLVEAAISHYYPDGFEDAAELERCEWLSTSTWMEHAHECDSCHSITFGDDYYTPTQCGNCLASLDEA